MDSWLPGHRGIERSILGTEMDGALSVAQGPAPLVRALVAQWQLSGCWTWQGTLAWGDNDLQGASQ